MNLMRTNSWTSRRRRRRRRASQARTLARWTGSCGNILPPRGGPGSPCGPAFLLSSTLALAPQAGLSAPLTPGPPRSVSQLSSDLALLGQASSLPFHLASPLPLSWSRAPGPSFNSAVPRGSWILVGWLARRPQERAGRTSSPAGPSLPREASLSSLCPFRLAFAWALDHTISLMQETGPYSGLIGGRGQGEPPLSN